MEQKIHIITLGVSDLTKSLEFYEKGLGWEKSKASIDGKIAFFDLGGIILSLFPKSALAKDANLSDDGHSFSFITLAHNKRSESEVDEVLKKVIKLGAKVVKPSERVSWGGYSGYFKDIDGHIFEVANNPHFEFD